MEILLVDDSTEFLESLKTALYEHGYTVYGAGNGVEACRILTIRPVDLIISDIRMPDMDGIKFHQWLRQFRRYAATRFVFLSGYRDEYSDTLRLVPERDFFLDKTTTLADILRFVDRLLFGKYAELWV